MDDQFLQGKTLLIVDDEIDLRDIVVSELEYMGAKVFQAENISVAQNLLNENKIDLIISDIRMPGGTGIDLLEAVKAKSVDAPPVILITGFADITIEGAYDKGAEALLHKPFKLDDLIKLVIRHTSSFEEKFKVPSEAQKTIEANISGDTVAFGRGGVSLPVELEGRKLDIGEVINFNFKMNGNNYQGQGVCRWLKSNDQGQSLLGLEFTHLEDQSLSSFRQRIESATIVPYIPAIQS
jgi:DNA-binding response OmpR family regulator